MARMEVDLQLEQNGTCVQVLTVDLEKSVKIDNSSFFLGEISSYNPPDALAPILCNRIGFFNIWATLTTIQQNLRDSAPVRVTLQLKSNILWQKVKRNFNHSLKVLVKYGEVS